MTGHSEIVNFIWSVADLLRGDYKASEYQKAILPFTVLRRLDCILEPTKDAVIKRAKSLGHDIDEDMRDKILSQAAGQNQTLYNSSLYTFEKLNTDADGIAANLDNLIQGFPKTIREIFIERFKFADQITRLEEADLLYLVTKRFSDINLHTDEVSNHDMGYVFEELIRKFSEQSNETAGEHFTPREVIRLMVNLLFIEDQDGLRKKGIIRTLYDPACGTGGMLSVAEDYVRELNPDGSLVVFGQELNPDTYAVCKSDMLIKGQNPENIKFGNSFSNDGTAGETFDYMLSNPPYGVEWKKVEREVREEAESKGLAGRFGAGLPPVSDGSLLFVQHMISKFKTNGPSRIAVVLNGSPLFTGGAGSGTSEIRRWIIENDWLEAIVALPDQLFYNTGISTYIWILTNKKLKARKGKIQLINAADCFQKIRRSLGDKRNEIAPDKIDYLTQLLGDFKVNGRSKIFDNEEFGYWRITVERPLRLNFEISEGRMAKVAEQSAFKSLAKSRKRGKQGEAEIEQGRQLQQQVLDVLSSASDEKIWTNRETFSSHLKGLLKAGGITLAANVFKAVLMGLAERDEVADLCTKRNGDSEPDPELRDTENVPLKDDIEAYFEREVKPHVPDAWIDEEKTRKGYEIPFARHFYEFVPPRPLEEIDAELKVLVGEIQKMLKEVVA